MTYKTHRMTTKIARLGREAILHSRQSNGKNGFNNTEWTFDSDPDNTGEDQTVLCFRTYPNRNTEVQQNSGDRNRDSPVFLFPWDDYEMVEDSDRIEYPEPNGGTTLYELQAPTRYETHVEIYGEVVNS